MSWHYLQGPEEVSSEAICWDGEQFAPSNGKTTLGGYCLPDSEMEFCHDFQSGMMCRPSTETHGEAGSMSFRVDSHARTSAQLGRAQESMAKNLECGTIWQGSFARYDHDSSLWRTPQYSLLEGLDVFSETWPRWGTMRNGACLEVTQLPALSCEKGYGFLPALTKADSLGTGKKRFRGSAEYRGGKTIEGLRTSLTDPQYIHPDFAEWVMGWPIGWTELPPLGMDKFQQWQQQHYGF